MSCILYYSKYCEVCKKYLQALSKFQSQNEIHFICIDKRVKDSNGKVFIILQTGQKLLMPENITRVPALLLLNQNYKVIYGDEIYKHLRPQVQQEIKKATKNNMEPLNFQDGFGAFSGFNGGIVSDNYSFLDQDDTELSVKGNGGLRQMHNYVTLNDSMNLNINFLLF
jgi:thiol-disulfide isomerase/thioredoxin